MNLKFKVALPKETIGLQLIKEVLSKGGFVGNWHLVRADERNSMSTVNNYI